MEVEARRFGFLFVLLLSPSGECNEQQVRAGRRLPKQLRNLVAIDIRKPYIQDHSVSLEFSRQPYSAAAITCCTRRVAFGLKQHGKTRSSVFVVIDDEDTTLFLLRNAGQDLNGSKVALASRHRKFDEELAAQPNARAAGRD